MENKSKALYVVVLILILGSIGFSYYQTFILRNYLVAVETDCNSTQERCFVRICEFDDKECEAKAAAINDTVLDGQQSEEAVHDETIEGHKLYYKLTVRRAVSFSDCSLEDGTCEEFVCKSGEIDCAEEFCSDENVPDGEECNNPEIH